MTEYRDIQADALEQTNDESAIFSSEAARVKRNKEYLSRQGKATMLVMVVVLCISAVTALVVSLFTNGSDSSQQEQTTAVSMKSDQPSSAIKPFL